MDLTPPRYLTAAVRRLLARPSNGNECVSERVRDLPCLCRQEPTGLGSRALDVHLCARHRDVFSHVVGQDIELVFSRDFRSVAGGTWAYVAGCGAVGARFFSGGTATVWFLEELLSIPLMLRANPATGRGVRWKALLTDLCAGGEVRAAAESLYALADPSAHLHAHPLLPWARAQYPTAPMAALSVTVARDP